jgi:hypothetical protein
MDERTNYLNLLSQQQIFESQVSFGSAPIDLIPVNPDSKTSGSKNLDRQENACATLPPQMMESILSGSPIASKKHRQIQPARHIAD